MSRSGPPFDHIQINHWSTVYGWASLAFPVCLEHSWTCHCGAWTLPWTSHWNDVDWLGSRQCFRPMTTFNLFLLHSSTLLSALLILFFQACQVGQEITSKYYNSISKVLGFPLSLQPLNFRKLLRMVT